MQASSNLDCLQECVLIGSWELFIDILKLDHCEGHDEWLWARSPILWTHCPMVKAEKMRSEALRSSSKEQFASQGVPEQRNWSIPVGIRHELEVVVRCWLIDEECMYELHCVAAKWDWHHNSGRRTLRLSPLDASVDRASASNMLQNRIRFKSL